MTNSRRHFLTTLAGAAAAGDAATQARPLVIDAQCHAGLGTQMTAPWTTRGDLDITLRHMQEAGIDRTIIFPVNNPTYTKANEAIAEMCGRYPDKLIGFAKHDPESEAGRVPAMLKREVEKLGLKGLKLHKLPTRDMLDAAAELGIPILWHPKAVSDFFMPAEEYPQIRFIMAHMGGYGSWFVPMQGIAVAKPGARTSCWRRGRRRRVGTPGQRPRSQRIPPRRPSCFRVRGQGPPHCHHRGAGTSRPARWTAGPCGRPTRPRSGARRAVRAASSPRRRGAARGPCRRGSRTRCPRRPRPRRTRHPGRSSWDWTTGRAARSRPRPCRGPRVAVGARPGHSRRSG